jgi:hypothetical protein
VGEGQEREAGGEKDATQRREAMARLRSGRAPGEGGHDWDPGGCSGRPPGGGDSGRDAEDHPGADRPPRQVEPVNPVPGDRLQPGCECEPPGQADCGAGHGGDGPHDGAIGQYDQPDVAVGRAEGPEHAKRPEPALGHHGVAGYGHQSDKEQPDGGQG